MCQWCKVILKTLCKIKIYKIISKEKIECEFYVGISIHINTQFLSFKINNNNNSIKLMNRGTRKVQLYFPPATIVRKRSSQKNNNIFKAAYVCVYHALNESKRSVRILFKN